jgi:hypothetical protein
LIRDATQEVFILSFLTALGMEPRAWHTLGKCSITQPHPQPKMD